MAQYYTLDEASQKLGISTDEFRKRLATQWKTIRRFPDGATLRFQSRDIDELARQLGRSSDPDLQLGEAPLSLAEEPASAISKKPAPNQETIFTPQKSDDFIPLAGDEHVISAGKDKKSGSDSDVKLESTAGGVRPSAGKDEPTEVLEVAEKKSGIKPKGSFEVKSDSPPRTPTKNAQITSEFDLSLNADSDEFELELADDSDEVPIGAAPRKGPRSGDSGINLQDPADSGISLEKDAGDAARSEPATPPTGRAAPPKPDDSDSEFELTLDDSGESESAVTAFDSGEQKDIFETDFELPAIDDSGSEVKSSDSVTDLEESDFDLSVDEGAGEEESGSEVVAIEEEAAEDELQPIEDEEEDARPVRVAAPVSADWGALPLIALIPCALVMFFVGVMSYELVHNMWGYHQPGKAAGPVVRTVAGMFGKLADE